MLQVCQILTIQREKKKKNPKFDIAYERSILPMIGT